MTDSYNPYRTACLRLTDFLVFLRIALYTRWHHRRHRRRIPLVSKPFSKTYPSVDKPDLAFGSCFTAASFTRGFGFAPELAAPQAF
jgi:hypothetical protein